MVYLVLGVVPGGGAGVAPEVRGEYWGTGFHFITHSKSSLRLISKVHYSSNLTKKENKHKIHAILLWTIKLFTLNWAPVTRDYMGRFPQDENYACFVSLYKILCWTAVAKPDLLGHFFQLFCGKHDLLTTLPQHQPPSNTLQCTAMHPKSPKCTELCHLKKNFVGPLWPNLICQATFLNCYVGSMTC